MSLLSDIWKSINRPESLDPAPVVIRIGPGGRVGEPVAAKVIRVIRNDRLVTWPHGICTVEFLYRLAKNSNADRTSSCPSVIMIRDNRGIPFHSVG